MSKNAKLQHKNATKKFDYTAIVDRLRTVSRSDYSNATDVINRFTGPTFTLPQQIRNQKGHTFKICKYTSFTLSLLI